MVAKLLRSAKRHLPVVLAAVAALGIAQPAAAGSAGSADVITPVETSGNTYVSPLGTGDSEFRRIFADWEKKERVRGTNPVEAATVAIPSIHPLRTGRVSSGYGVRRHPVLGGRRKHNGVDLAAPTGTPVYATADGLVSRANWFSSYGKYISIEHGGQIQTRFAHLSRIAVRNGQSVKKGDLIGFVGSTGRSTGPHLHYEVRVSGRPVNPLQYMTEPDPRQAVLAAAE